MRKFTEKEIAEIYSGWFKKKLESGQNQNEFLPVLIRAARLWFGISEEWRDVEDWAGFYQVSSFSRIKSLDRIIVYPDGHERKFNGQILRMTLCVGTGYLQVNFKRNSVVKRMSVHRLVSMSFIENTLSKPQVNHKNSIRNDNRIDNLEWCTASENLKHGFKYGNMVCNTKGRYGSSHPCSKKVIQLSITGEYLSTFGSIVEAVSSTNASDTGISECCRNTGRYKSSGGYKWKFAKDYYGTN